MIEVEFQHDYSNNEMAFTAGQRTELSEAQIEFLERDSPGCLKRIDTPDVDKAVKKPKLNKALETAGEDKEA